MRELQRVYGLKLGDVRKQKNVGAADQHGRDYELKAPPAACATSSV
jgi:hypothetical protein